MTKSKQPKQPKYCLHKPSGRGYVELGGKQHYLQGKHGSEETLQYQIETMSAFHSHSPRLTSLVISSLVICSCFVLSHHLLAEELKSKHVVHIRTNVAHRGASFVAPENTLVAYRTAIKAGANGGECDVYRSADGVLFLSHDKTAKRTMGGSEDDLLTKMTFGQIRKFDAGSWKGEQFMGEPVPTLDEYLKLLNGTKCYPVIEIKQVGIEADVLECIRKNKLVDEATIIAFSADVVREIRRLEPNICVAWLYSENLKDKGTAEENAERLADLILQRCRELDVVIVDLTHQLLSPKLIKRLNGAGIHVWTWTVNDAESMKQYLDWGVVSITTDKPELLSQILAERK